MKAIKGVLIIAAMFASAPVFAQTNLNFTTATVTTEGAIRLSWNSTTNEVYQIDYANELVDTNTGTTTWLPLYTDYPSHGTNTFWLDTGNYSYEVPVLHPRKAPLRFYRIVNLAPDNAISKPVIAINDLTNNSVVSEDLIVQVSASTDQATLFTKLYVDGEEMNPSIDSTNYSVSGTNFLIDTYLINTCEWPNGLHTLFATAKCASDVSGPINASSILLGHAVCAYLPVTFDNLITRYSFSEPFFDPDAGQTQHVSAVFTSNCDWMLEIQDADTNTVRYATGSGAAMQFDGTERGPTARTYRRASILICCQYILTDNRS